MFYKLAYTQETFFPILGLPVISVGVPLGRDMSVYKGSTDRLEIKTEISWFFLNQNIYDNFGCI